MTRTGTYEEDLALAHRLADAAGEAIRPYFRSEFSVDRKGDASPVTEADRAAEEAMRAILQKERPHDGIIGEEFGEKAGSSDRVWVLDPIDGTTSFIAGRPIFGTLVAMLDRDWPMIGVIDQPISRERWDGCTGLGATFNGKPAQARACRELSEAVLATTSPHLFSDHDAGHFMDLAKSCDTRRLIWGGDCYNYGLVASGHVDIVAESGLKLYDFAALVPIVEGAGGFMCDWSGDPLSRNSDGRVLAIGDPARADEILEVIACGH
jgi:inositol-phosphate phosphatase / L-galactose 1-phosphate phosphatase / histidinol-phosphatase